MKIRTRKRKRVRAPERRISTPNSDGLTPGTPAPPEPVAPDEERIKRIAELRVHAQRSKAAFLELCRLDVNVFCEYVLQDARTGGEVQQAEHHVKMHAALDRFRYVITMAFPESGKTSQIAVGRVLHKLGNNPRLRILMLNEAQKGGSEKTLSTIKRYIEGKVTDDRGVSRLHEVFPDLRKGDKWAENSIRVSGAAAGSRDLSVQAIGYRGAILGSRLDMVVIDDLLTHNTTRTATLRHELKRWLENSIWSRLDDDAEVAFLTNAWHPKDAAHTLGWFTLKFPVFDRLGRPTWPERWPVERVNRVRTKLKMSALEFARSFLCKPKDPGSQIFKEDALTRSLVNGEGRSLVSALERIPDGCIVVTGVDLAASKKREGAKTAIVTILVHPNEDRQIIGIQTGRWGAREILRRIVQAGARYGGIVMVENNGVQQWMVELARDNRDLLAGEDAALVPIYPYMTGKRKADPTFGIEGLAGEMEAGGWMFPNEDGQLDPEVQELVDNLEAYTPTDHTADNIMALWLAVEGARRIIQRKRARREDRGGLDARIIG